jgi:hypothetical protein
LGGALLSNCALIVKCDRLFSLLTDAVGCNHARGRRSLADRGVPQAHMVSGGLWLHRPEIVVHGAARVLRVCETHTADMGTDRDRIFTPMAGDLFFDPSCRAGLAFKNASGRLAMSEDTCVHHVQAGPRGRSVTIAPDAHCESSRRAHSAKAMQSVRHARVSADAAASMERCDLRKVLMVAAIALVMVAAMKAQSALTGVWEGASPGGERVTFDAKVTDTTLTGTVTINGDGKTIADGTFVNNAVSFTITLLNGTTQAFGRELVGEELRLWAARRGPGNAVILKRVKS